MDIQVGDRVTYEVVSENDDIKIRLILNELHIEEFNIMIKNKDIEIIKHERIGENGWYTVYEKEEKKELLTEEEREFLRLFIKVSDYYINNIMKKSNCIRFYNDYDLVTYIDINNFYFNKLENNKEYTLSELGLEER